MKLTIFDYRNTLTLNFMLALFAFVQVGIAQEKIRVKADFTQLDLSVSKDIGIGVNFLSDSPSVAKPLSDLNVRCIRYATNGYVRFDPKRPETFQIAVEDSSIWQVKGFANEEKWFSKLSFDQFITMCQSMKAEPCVVIPIDAIAYTGGSPHVSTEQVLESAVDWVRYANVKKEYNVRYWEIGNESDLNSDKCVPWTAERYSQTVKLFSKAMKAVDPTIQIGANGMRVNSGTPWWDEVLPIVSKDIDFLITHQYSWLES